MKTINGTSYGRQLREVRVCRACIPMDLRGRAVRPGRRAAVEKTYGKIYGKGIRQVSTAGLRGPCVGSRATPCRSVKTPSGDIRNRRAEQRGVFAGVVRSGFGAVSWVRSGFGEEFRSGSDPVFDPVFDPVSGPDSGSGVNPVYNPVFQPEITLETSKSSLL